MVKLKYDQGKIEFSDPLFSLIKSELLRLVEEIQKCSQNFPRPENNIARSEKINLWSLPADDQNFVHMKENIEAILDENLKNVEGCLEIFEKFAYLLKEVDKAVAWAG